MNNSYPGKSETVRLFERRAFIIAAINAAGASALLAVPGIDLASQAPQKKDRYTVQDIINIILKEIPGAPFKQTVDTIKAGSALQEVTGIVTTMFPTVKVIEAAARIKANFIIAHEPSFYNHTDDPNWIPGNEVLRMKQSLLTQDNITIWRFHDYWHSHRPDGITYGVLKSAGWLDHYKPDQSIVQLNPITLSNLVAHLKSTLNINHIRMIGDPEQQCRTIALMPGAAGGQRQIAIAEKVHPDVLIVGEVHEWETAEYIRDARQLGSKIALIVLGHGVSEEPGMQWLVEWLQPKLNGLPITHLASEDPFTWI
jgi:putative NIF3 family GTP cyclohydrolase 1 type 2